MSVQSVVDFVPLLGYEDSYEILNQYPFTIRRKKDHYVIRESLNSNGYTQVHLNGRTYEKHRLIALQFLPNPDPDHLTQVDHMNKQTNDYHLENLRWVTISTNAENRTSHMGIEYRYVDNIPDDSITVTDYGTHYFNNYFFNVDADRFYFHNGVAYRELHINEERNGSLFVNMKDTNNRSVRVYYLKFKKLYDLV